MHYKWDKKYLYWGITFFLVICACIFFYYILFHGLRFQSAVMKGIHTLSPIIYGFAIAYVLSPIANLIERSILLRIHKARKTDITAKIKKRDRYISVLATILLALLIIYGLFAMLIPQITKSVQSIVLQSGIYISNITNWLNNITVKYPQVQTFLDNMNINLETDSIVQWINDNIDIQKYVANIGEYFSAFYNGVYGIVMTLFNFCIGFIISVYLLMSKETFAGQAKKIVYAVCEKRTANRFIKNMRFVHKTFIGFIIGKVVDSLIIGILCFIGTSIIGTPYAVLVSVIVGVTNVIPFFGPYLGAIPSALFILVIDPLQCIYFLIFVFLLQQLDGNYIGPKILGDSTGLSSFWVIFAITVFGGMFGIFGMFVGVPVFAVIFAGFKTLFDRMLKKKGLPIETQKYVRVQEIRDKEFVELPNQDEGFPGTTNPKKQPFWIRMCIKLFYLIKKGILKFIGLFRKKKK